MILYIHKSHNNLEWDFGAHQARVYKFYFLVTKGFKTESSCKEIVVEKVQMRITEEGELEIGEIDMGGLE